MKEEITKPVVIYYDNTSVINISKNLVMHAKTNNIEIKYHYLRELVQDKEVRLEYVNTNESTFSMWAVIYILNLLLHSNYCFGQNPLIKVDLTIIL